jgi:hypothetical protein
VFTAVAIALLAGQVTSFQVVEPPARDTIAQKGTASVKGKVVAGDTGKALRRVQVSISSPDLTESRSISSTAQGVFEFKELPAGRYTITASRAGFLTVQVGQRRVGEPGRPIQIADRQQIADLTIAMPRTGTIAGRITDEVGEPLANVTIFPAHWRYFRGKKRLVRAPGGASFNRTDETGQYRITGLEPGEYFVMANTRDTWTMEDNPKERIGFLTTYSGGTPSPSEAQPVKVSSGQEAIAPDIAMVPGRVASVSGTALSASGAPLAGESLEIVQEFASPSGSYSSGMPGTRVNPDGTWTIKALPPGEYRLTVRSPGDKERPGEAATVPIVIAGEDLTGVTLVTGGGGGTVSGRIVTDTGVPVPQAERRIVVSARPVDPTRTVEPFYNQENGRVKDDWTFQIKDVVGRHRLSVNPVPREWAIKSIDYEGKDLMDTPIDVGSGQHVEGVTVVLSKTLPKLVGRLLDDGGQPADGSILIFPQDEKKWEESSRLIRTIRPDESSGFEFRNVIPGDYFVVPLEYVRQGDWSDPEFLTALKDQAKRVKVAETGSTAVMLTLKRQQH